MTKVKKIGVLSLGKFFGIFYALMGLIFGVFFSIRSLIGFSTGTGTGLIGTVFGISAIILLPIFYGLLGFVFGIISAVLYNLVAKWIGGIEIETE